MSGLLDKTHAELYEMRRKADAEQQGLLAPLEHRAFAREWATDSPFAAGISLPFAIPAYTAYKASGLSGARSPASWDEIKHGYMGLAEGLLGRRFQ